MYYNKQICLSLKFKIKWNINIIKNFLSCYKIFFNYPYLKNFMHNIISP